MKKIFILILLLYLFQLAAAVICGPYSCEWGNGFYFIVGLLTVIVIVLCLLLQKAWSLIRRLGYAALFSFLSVVVWVIGFLLGDFRILCRLF